MPCSAQLIDLTLAPHINAGKTRRGQRTNSNILEHKIQVQITRPCLGHFEKIIKKNPFYVAYACFIQHTFGRV